MQKCRTDATISAPFQFFLCSYKINLVNEERLLSATSIVRMLVFTSSRKAFKLFLEFSTITVTVPKFVGLEKIKKLSRKANPFPIFVWM